MLNEQKITYRMKTLIESGFFGTKSLLTEAFADKDKVRLFQAAYNYTYDKNIAVDGIKGTQTNAAIEDVKKQLGKDKLDDAGANEFYQKFLVKLDEKKSSINVGQGGANTNKVLNYAIQTLINLAGTPLGIDGVVGTKTIAAIKTVADDSEVINTENITTITGKAVENILQLGIEGIATVQGGAAKTPEQIEAESRKAWEKYPCVAKAAGVKENKLKDGSIAYVDKDNANIYYANGRKMRLSDDVKDNYYCNGMTVTISGKSDYETAAMQSAADETKKKQAFNEELKKLIEVVKTYPADKQNGNYELYRGFKFMVTNRNKLILSSQNIFSDLRNISSVGKWVYNPQTNSISFNNGKYVYKP